SRVPEGFNVSGRFHNKQIELVSEGDFSAASFLLVAGLLSSESGITVSGLRRSSVQPDAAILDLLPCHEMHENGESYYISRKKTQSIIIDANVTPDLAPPIALVGMFSDAGCKILNPGRLRIKESDRYAEIISMARSFGARIDDSGDALSI
ncbi:3-phosphoshikimate 1-carboxyvinyltransferase, partial [mine drainage metagenome]